VLLEGFVLGAQDAYTFGDALFQLFAFLVLLAGIKIFAWAPLMKVMKDREEYVAGEIEKAEKSRAEANALLEQHKQMIQNARQETQLLMENARKQAEAQRDEIINLAKVEAERLKEQALMEIQQEREKAVSALREQVASLSVLIASKVIEKEISEKDQEAFIQEIINKAGEGQ